MKKTIFFTSLMFSTFFCFLLAVEADSPRRDSTATSDATQEIELLGVGQISSDAIDFSNLDQEFSPGLRNNMMGGFSAIVYSGSNDIYYLLPDRGPQDGAVDWNCRIEKIRMTFDAKSKSPVKTELLSTILLRDVNGNFFTGLSSAFESSPEHSARLDPEGIRLDRDGHFFISDEYGPHIIEFNATGQFVRELSVPKKFLVECPAVSKKTENAKNDVGRPSNHGMEGLAISPDGQMLIGLMQAPLLQDSGRKDRSEKPAGTNCRMLRISTDGKMRSELLYHLDSEACRTNEILAVDGENYLVIERDGESGNDAKFKKLMLVSTAGASEISGIDSLPKKEVPVGVTAVRKKVLIDLLDAEWKLAGDAMPEKIEGLTFGPDLTDGRRTLIVCSDNDFVHPNPTQIYVFAIPAEDLQW